MGILPADGVFLTYSGVALRSRLSAYISTGGLINVDVQPPPPPRSRTSPTRPGLGSTRTSADSYPSKWMNSIPIVSRGLWFLSFEMPFPYNPRLCLMRGLRTILLVGFFDTCYSHAVLMLMFLFPRLTCVFFSRPFRSTALCRQPGRRTAALLHR